MLDSLKCFFRTCAVTFVLGGIVSVSWGVAAHATEAEAREKLTDALYERSAQFCTYHSKAATLPGVQAFVKSVATEDLSKVTNRKIIMCPNPKLDVSLGVIWYGDHNVIVWNTSAKGSDVLVGDKLGAMAKADEYPPGVDIWNADGTKPKPGSTVPGFDYAVKMDQYDKAYGYDYEDRY